MKKIRLISIFFLSLFLTSCDYYAIYPDLVYTFEDRIRTTDEGLVYINVTQSIDNKSMKTISIIDIPKVSQFEIPKVIEGIDVITLGYLQPKVIAVTYHFVESDLIESIIVGSKVYFDYVKFPNCSTLIYKNNIHSINLHSEKEVIIDNYIFHTVNFENDMPITNIELVGSLEDNVEKEENYKIYLSSFVNKIDQYFFSNLTNSTFYVYFDEKPDGWEDGWNGDNNVVWGVKEYEPIDNEIPDNETIDSDL